MTELGRWLERAVPQPSQNLAPARFNVPHDTHCASIGAPHPSQNFAVSRFSAPHFEQRIFSLTANYPFSSSSSALASFRSAVSKPSVNQL